MDPLRVSEFWGRYSGDRYALGIALFNHDPYDQFAWCQSYRFAICDILTFDRGEYVPEFYSSGPETDDAAYQELTEAATRVTTDSLWYALKILDRYREWLRLAGEDY